MKHIISALVQNKPGVLAHVAGMFAARAFNIDSLVVGRTDEPDDFPEPCFSPMRFLAPESHPWPETDDATARD